MTEPIPIGVLLKVCSRENEQLLSRKAEELGLTGAQMHILHFICRHSGQVVLRDIEQKFDLTHATASGIITRLETKGFLHREEDREDRRRSVLFAEEKAQIVEGQVHASILANEKQMLSDFTPEERDQLQGYLVRLLGNLGLQPPHPRCEKEEETC